MSVKLNKILTDLETGCNIIDTIPVVGVVSSALRIGVGKAQFTAGACIALVGVVGVISGNNKNAWRNVVRYGMEQMLHGALNIIRGIGTLLLASVGLNILLLPWQLIRTDGFAPVVPYGHGFKSNAFAPAVSY